MRRIWLASYPKSGNTWMRMLIRALSHQDDAPFDINDVSQEVGIGSARGVFDDVTLIDSGLLTHDEIDALRPAVYEALACEGEADDDTEQIGAVRFVKVHDAYTVLPNGEALLAGRKGADGAILIVRDPRAIAPSLADHNGIDLDEAIAQLNDPAMAYCAKVYRQGPQMRQRLLDWGGHARSWLDQRDLPVLALRYEDMIADTAGALAKVLAFAEITTSAEQIERAVSLSAFSRLRALEEATGFNGISRKSSGGRFFRRGEPFAWRNELSPEQIARLEHVHGTMMQSLGYTLYRDLAD